MRANVCLAIAAILSCATFGALAAGKAPEYEIPFQQIHDTCSSYLAEELSLLANAHVYLALGAFAYDCLCRLPALRGGLPTPRPRFAHGTEVALFQGEKMIVCTYHPSQRNVFTGLLTPAMMDAALERAHALGA